MKNYLILLLVLACYTAQGQVYIATIAPITSNSVGKYQKFEVGVQLSTTAFTNPYDPDEIDVSATFTSPSNTTYDVNGFWYVPFNRCNGCADPTINGCDYNYHVSDPNYLTPTSTNSLPWRVRFAANETGVWSYVIKMKHLRNNEVVSSTYTFSVTSSTNKGYVKIGDNNRSFKFNDQSLFAPMGANFVNGIGSYTYNRLLYKNVIDGLQKLNNTGANTLRLLMHPTQFGIEWSFDADGDGTQDGDGLGIYETRQRRANDLDNIVEFAETNDVYIQLCFLDHNEFRESQPTAYINWDQNPYKWNNNTSCIDFFTNPISKNLFKNRLRYIIARWGYSTGIFAFELMNEINQYTHYWDHDVNRLILRVWQDEMLAYCKTLDNHHLYTNSTAGIAPEYFGDENVRLYSSQELDFLQGHYYTRDYNGQTQFNELIKLAKHRYNKPYFWGEYGHGGDLDQCDLASSSYYTKSQYSLGNWVHDNNVFHNQIWINSFGGAGTGFTWDNGIFHPCYGGPYKNFKPLSDFLKNEDIFKGDYKIISTDWTGINGTSNAGPIDDNHTSKFSGTPPYGWPSWTTDEPISPVTQPKGIATSNDGEVEVFGIKNDDKILGWIHLKDNYWYNLDHKDFWGNMMINGSQSWCSGKYNANQFPYVPNVSVPDVGDVDVTINDVCDGNYKVEFYSTYPSYPLSNSPSSPKVDGGIIPAYTINSVSAYCGSITFQAPDFKALGKQPPYAPDYGFKLTKLSSFWVHHNPDNDASHLVGSSTYTGTAVVATDNHVFYADNLGRLNHLYPTSNNQWAQVVHTDWNNPASQDVKGSLAADPTDNRHVFYRGTDDRLHHYYYENSTWYHIWHTDWNSYDQNVYGDVATANGHVFYEGQDHKLHLYEYGSGNVWYHSILSSTTPGNNSQNVYGAIAVDQSGNHVFYRGAANMLNHFYFENGSWHHVVHYTGNNDDLVGGDIQVSADARHVFYKGTDNRLHQYYFENNTWHHIWHTNWNGTDQNITGNLTVSPDGTHVFYVGNPGYVHHYYYTGNSNWVHDFVICWDQIRSDYEGSMYITGYNNEKVFYKGTDGRMHAFIYGSGCQRNTPENSSGFKETYEGENPSLASTEQSQFNTASKKHNFVISEDNSINISPNPFTNKIVVTSYLNKQYTVVLSNIVGQELHRSTINSQSYEINTETYVSGMYVVKILDEKGNMINYFKLTKQ